MARRKDNLREHRITDEIIVDANGPEEQAIGWYCYLDEHLAFPFQASCIRERSISPLQVGETVKVIGMGPAQECEKDMFVAIEWNGRALCVPLSQLKGEQTDKDTNRALEDWHYWVDRGYEF